MYGERPERVKSLEDEKFKILNLRERGDGLGVFILINSGG